MGARWALACLLGACSVLLQGCLQCNTEAASPLCSLAKYLSAAAGQDVLVEQIRSMLGPELERAGVSDQGDIWETLAGTEFSELRAMVSQAAADPSQALEPLLETVKSPMVAKITGLASHALEDAEVTTFVGDLLKDCSGREVLGLLKAAGTDPLNLPSHLFDAVVPSLAGKFDSWESAQGVLRPLRSLFMKLPFAAKGVAATALLRILLGNPVLLLSLCVLLIVCVGIALAVVYIMYLKNKKNGLEQRVASGENSKKTKEPAGPPADETADAPQTGK